MGSHGEQSTFGAMVAQGPEPQPRVSLRPKRKPVVAILLACLLLGAAGFGAYAYVMRTDGTATERTRAVRACDIPLEILERVWRGYVPGRSGDVLTIERLPNQYNTRHSTPFAYTQDVPLVLYGPGYIKKGVASDRDTTVADLVPTFAELLRFELPVKVDGRPLREALLPPERRNGIPKLIITIVWDGGGDNVLEQWPDSWPELEQLMARGASYSEAAVGSSPSITPSIHANIGTGVFPKRHGLSDTRMRIGNKTVDAYEGGSPRYLRALTLGDMWDLANGNEPLVGMMARDNWHLGMIGHGTQLEGGDADIAVMDDFTQVEFRTSEEFYSLPDYMLGNEGLDAAIAEVDQRDGEADERWLGNPLVPIDGKIRFTPAWSIFQTEKMKELLTNEGFGQDDIADLFFVNYKSTDLVGHEFNMVDPEEKEALEEQDRQLAEVIRFLDEFVGRDDYVLALTADHGMTPYPSVTGGWSIVMTETSADIENRFDETTPDVPLILSNRGYQIMLDEREMERNDVTAEEVAAFLRSYTIGQNAPNEEALGEFSERTDERIFLTALTPEQLKEALQCARSA
jgi:predicted AlkP superfamily pyrophosphatase or phosphodiesterase